MLELQAAGRGDDARRCQGPRRWSRDDGSASVIVYLLLVEARKPLFLDYLAC